MEKLKCIWETCNFFVRENLFLVLVVLVGGFWFFGGSGGSNGPVVYRQNIMTKGANFAMTDSAMEREEMTMSKPMRYEGQGGRMGFVPPVYAEFEPDAEDRKIVKNATLNIEVSDTEAAREKAEMRIGELGGSITQMNSWEARPEVLAYNFIVRIPADKLESAIENLAKLGIKKAENFSTQDITAQYMDTESRLKNLYARRDRLRKMMERDTKNLGDVLSIDRELSSVQIQIENYERTQKKRNTDVAYSTLHLTINPETQIGDFTNPNWNVVKTWRTAVNDLIRSAQKIVDKFIRLVVYVPIWVPIVLIVWWGRKKWRQRKNNS